MKRLSLLVAMVMTLCSSMLAQTTIAECNRILLNTKTGTVGFITDRVDDLTFAKVDGEVKANLQILSYDGTLTVAVTKSANCVSYRLGVIPAVVYNMLADDAQLISYVNSRPGMTTTFTEDYTHAELSGLDLIPGTEYVLFTIGIDSYGIDCDVSVQSFETEGIPVIGNPQVDVKVTDTTTRTISLTFTPNADCTAYYFVLGPKDSLQEQYEQYAPMFGFNNIGDMVRMWGTENKGVVKYQYKDLDPSTDYELYVLCLDKESNPAPVQIVNMATSKQGGTGAAVADAVVTGYRLSDWDGEMKPSVFVKFVPNSETLAYRFGVFTADAYESQKDLIYEELAQDPPMPNMAYWFWYDALETDFQVNPNTPIVICTVAKNANNEWGELHTVRYTTPATADAAAPAKTLRAPKPAARKAQLNTVPAQRRLTLSPTH